METEYRLCVNCKHYKPAESGKESDARCWHENNLIVKPTISLVTGKPIPPVIRFNVISLEHMRDGPGYCGEKGEWYGPRELKQMVEDAPLVEDAQDKANQKHAAQMMGAV